MAGIEKLQWTLPTPATGMAIEVKRSEHRHLWRGLRGIVYPNWYLPGASGGAILTAPWINGLRGIGVIQFAQGRFGRYIDFNTAGGAGNCLRWTSASTAGNRLKFSPPFSLMAISLTPGSGQPANAKYFFYTSDEKPGVGNYSGYMVEGSEIFQAGNASNDPANWTKVTVSMISGADQWNQGIVTCGPTIQGEDIDANNCVKSWINGMRVSTTTTAGESLSIVQTRHTQIGWQTAHASFNPGTLYLALWLMWDRQLGLGEVDQLIRDPWSIFRLRRTIVGMAPSGGRIVSAGGYFKRQTRTVLVG